MITNIIQDILYKIEKISNILTAMLLHCIGPFFFTVSQTKYYKLYINSKLQLEYLTFFWKNYVPLVKITLISLKKILKKFKKI